MPLVGWRGSAPRRGVKDLQELRGVGIRLVHLRELRAMGNDGDQFDSDCRAPGGLPGRQTRRLRPTRCFSAHSGHRVCPGMAWEPQSGHRPSCLALCFLSVSTFLWASRRSGRCRRRCSYSCLLRYAGVPGVGFGRGPLACLAGWGLPLFGESRVSGPVIQPSFACLAAARLLFS